MNIRIWCFFTKRTYYRLRSNPWLKAVFSNFMTKAKCFALKGLGELGAANIRIWCFFTERTYYRCVVTLVKGASLQKEHVIASVVTLVTDSL